MNLSSVWRSVRNKFVKHSPEILIGIGITGMITTTVLAVSETPKALKLIEEKKIELDVDKLTVAETVEAAWKCYIPAAVTGVLSTACLIGASSVNLKRNAALATAYTLSETAMREYRDKVVETIGEKKEEAIRDSIAKDKIDEHPVSNTEVIITGKGETLCYDVFNDRYFKSDIDKLKRAANEVSHTMLIEGYVSLNEFYEAVGLKPVSKGYDLGWNANKSRDLVEIDPSAQLTEDGTPCIVLNFKVAPSYNYDLM